MIRKAILLVIGLILLGPPMAFAEVDLYNKAVGQSVTAADGSIWQVVDPQTSGTGVFDPFVRIQANGTESGYNTDASPNPPLDAKAGTFTHSEPFSNVATTTFPQVGGTGSYYLFKLDMDEPSATSTLSLDKFEIWSGTIPDAAVGLTVAGEPDFGSISGATFKELYNFTGGPVLMDWNITKGGIGVGDMQVFIPTADVLSPTGQYMYLFTSFGAFTGSRTLGPASDGITTNDWKSDDGPENWAVLAQTTSVPEPTILLLLGCGLIGLAGLRKRLQK